MFFKDGYVPKQEIACGSYEDAAAIQKVLLENGYCVMVSREEQLWIVNYIWSPTADRNDVIFASREEYEWEEMEWQKAHPEVKWEDEEDQYCITL